MEVRADGFLSQPLSMLCSSDPFHFHVTSFHLPMAKTNQPILVNGNNNSDQDEGESLVRDLFYTQGTRTMYHSQRSVSVRRTGSGSGHRSEEPIYLTL